VQHAILSDVNHLKVRIEAPAIAKMDALSLALEICSRAGAPDPQILPLRESDTTRAAWLKDEVMSKLIGAVDAVRGTKLVWLTFLDLNKAEIDGKGASELLYLLYEQVQRYDWLRIVLDGMQGAIQASLINKVARYDIAPVTEAEIIGALRRAIAERTDNVPPAADLKMSAKLLSRAYQTARTLQQDNALAELATSIKEAVEASNE